MCWKAVKEQQTAVERPPEGLLNSGISSQIESHDDAYRFAQKNGPLRNHHI